MSEAKRIMFKDTSRFPSALTSWRKATSVSQRGLAETLAKDTGMSIDDCAMWLDDIEIARADLTAAPAEMITALVSRMYGWFTAAIEDIGKGDTYGLMDELFGKEAE